MFKTPHEKQTIYLSGSWDSDHSFMNLFVASLLEEDDLIVIADHPSRPSERGMNYPARVNEHLRNCAGIVLVFPYREFHRQTTSSAMFIELLLAAKYKLPMLVLLEEGVSLDLQVEADETTLVFGPTDRMSKADILRFDGIEQELEDGRINFFRTSFVINNVSGLTIPTPSFIDAQIRLPLSQSRAYALAPRIRSTLETFLESLVRPTRPQHVFQVSPYHKDADRKIIAEVVFQITGLKCLNASDEWAGSPLLSEPEIVKLIKTSLLVIADVSGNRPACLFETGCAVGAGLPITLVRERTADELPFGLGKLKLFEYDNESELRAAVLAASWPFRRRVFNVELDHQFPAPRPSGAGDEALNLRLGAQLDLMKDVVFPLMLEAQVKKQVTFHGPVGTYIDGGGNSHVTTNQTLNVVPDIRQVVEESSRRRPDISLSIEQAEKFDLAIASLRRSIAEEKPEPTMVRQGLVSLRHVFEHAAGALIAHEAPTWLPAIIGQIEGVIRSLG